MAEEKKENIDIEEAKKHVTELLVIDSEDATKRKIVVFAETYKLFSKTVRVSGADVVRAFEMKYGLDVSFDKEGEVVITKSSGVRP